MFFATGPPIPLSTRGIWPRFRKGKKGIENECPMAMPMGLEPTITGETVRRISHYATAPYKQDIVKDLNLLVSVLQTNSLPKVLLYYVLLSMNIISYL